MEQSVGEFGRVQDFTEQQQAAPGVLVMRDLNQDVADFRVAGKTLGALQEPDTKLTFGFGQVGDQFGVIALGIVDEKAGGGP